MSEKPTIICITPVKNEAWILEKFLTITSLWADHIIIADQNSTDGSQQIAAEFPKVILIHNPGGYDEFERTRLMFNEVRKIKGRKLVIAVDADEFLSANYMDSPEWEMVMNLPKGSIIQAERVNVLGDLKSYFAPLKMVIGLMDDDVTTIEDTSRANVHNIRLPWPPNANVVELKDIKVLHYDAVDYRRVTSKLRWYQTFERTVNKLTPLQLLRKYKMYSGEKDFLASTNFVPTDDKWFAGYREKGIDMHAAMPASFWWDDEVLNYLDKNGTGPYKLIDVWGKDWVAEAKAKGLPNPERFNPDLNPLDKWVYKYWKKNVLRNHHGNGIINRVLNLLGYN